ncbi:hypothetical protein CWC22_016915 [Pseudoalteromonas rubra]|uniref:Uncharacterized protein n=1 Tax=Pseudoalteromonas rubra TaxID=43658 RepID=A0A5S3URT0_9GAMM|nr:hypothetical protein [Pseudoalteromonas rubra]QPB84574.1 hypothetical protein CWC22_016915 [Pseudoalteromonas rubra]
MKEVYAIMEYAPLAAILLGLALSWKVATARWFLLAYGFFEVLDIATLPITMRWNTHYYIADVVINAMFLLPIIFRRNLALRLYIFSGSHYFKRVYRLQRLSAQECGIILLLGLTCVVNVVTWLEVLAYKYYIFDSAPFKLYVRDNLMLLFHLMISLALFAYSMTANSREEFVEREKAY